MHPSQINNVANVLKIIHLMENLLLRLFRGDFGDCEEFLVFLAESKEINSFLTPPKLNLGKLNERDFFWRVENVGRSVP